LALIWLLDFSLSYTHEITSGLRPQANCKDFCTEYISIKYIFRDFEYSILEGSIQAIEFLIGVTRIFILGRSLSEVHSLVSDYVKMETDIL
jgi:hypothetical protein